ncbi:MAG: hypothetical protein Q8S73_23495 [Deltaproteobacteria bacterium]|nr:hypothetical protein [Myxococcales bacterium]MDP3217095.1 hypothetical protein [Deltaproteobacteria bacterium]
MVKKRVRRPAAATVVGPTEPLMPRLPEAHQPPREVTPEMFLEWRSPRVGTANPERQSNPVWAWLAGCPELNAWMANQHFRGPSAMAAGPGWCNQRFGQSRTALPDGRTVLVAGEHEDHYDPDFYIYNDVMLVDPAGGIEVYGYPHEAFPPTDFHSATRVDGRLLILGCLGYPRQRVPGVTPAFALDLADLSITPVATTGEAPGWIFRHTAELSADQRTITVRGGERVELVADEQAIRENIDDWSLDLDRLVWTRLTARRWPLWELRRADGKPNELMHIRWMSWHVGRTAPFDLEQLQKFEAQLGWSPDFAVYNDLYAPPLEHTRLDDLDDAVGTVRIVVAGVTVRYVEERRSVRITIEGALPPETAAALIEDARSKLSAVERTPYTAAKLRE